MNFSIFGVLNLVRRFVWQSAEKVLFSLGFSKSCFLAFCFIWGGGREPSSFCCSFMKVRFVAGVLSLDHPLHHVVHIPLLHAPPYIFSFFSCPQWGQESFPSTFLYIRIFFATAFVVAGMSVLSCRLKFCHICNAFASLKFLSRHLGNLRNPEKISPKPWIVLNGCKFQCSFPTFRICSLDQQSLLITQLASTVYVRFVVGS